MRTSPIRGYWWFGFLMALVLNSGLTAQQQNTLLGGLSVNGVGALNSITGAVLPAASMVTPAPPGGAPLYYLAASARSSLEIRIKGPGFGLPIVLAAGPMAAAPANLGGFLLELAFPGLTFLVEGTAPAGNLLNASATLGIGNEWALIIPQGLPQGAPPVHLQAAIADPTQPLMFRLTGTVTIETRNNIDTLVRNLTDAYVQSARNPNYLFSLMTPDFLWSGASSGQFLGQAMQEQSSFEAITNIDEVTVGANDTHPATAAPASGAPAPGQSSTFHFGLRQQSVSCGTPAARALRERMYNIKATEQAGVWKLRGDQAAAEVSVRLNITPGTSNASGLDVMLEFGVWDDIGTHGGISAVNVFGPQLASLNGSSQSTSPAAGTQALTNGGGGSWDSWSLNVPLAVTAAGTSRMPWVENATGPRDLYCFQIMWNDSTVSGSLIPPVAPIYSNAYAIPLRAAFDVALAAGQAAALAAIPNVTTPAPVLSNPGLPGAMLAMTVLSGTIATQSLRGAISIELDQNMGGGGWHSFGELMLDVSGPGASQGLSLCTSGLLSAVSTPVYLVREDVFETRFTRNLNLTF